jgi:hypothetical protein
MYLMKKTSYIGQIVWNNMYIARTRWNIIYIAFFSAVVAHKDC